MAKKDSILTTKLFGNKTIEDLNQELYEDFVLTKDNIEVLLEKGINEMKDTQTTMLLLPNMKGLLDTGLKNSANMNQLIAIITKTASVSEVSTEDSMSDIRRMMKDRGIGNKEIATA